MIALASGTQVGPTTWRGLLPFVLLALGARWAVRAMGWLRRHMRRIQQVGGAFLIAIGVALVTGLWGELIAWLRGPISGFTIPI